MLLFQLYDTSSKYLETWIWLSPLAIIMARRAHVMTARARRICDPQIGAESRQDTAALNRLASGPSHPRVALCCGICMHAISEQFFNGSISSITAFPSLKQRTCAAARKTLQAEL